MVTNAPLWGINVRDDNGINYAKLICSGLKTIETRNSNSLNAYVGKRVRIIRTKVKGQKSTIVGECTIGSPIIYNNETEFEEAAPFHLVDKDSIFWIKENCIKYGYPIIEPVLYDVPYLAVGMGVVSRANQPPPPEFCMELIL